MSAAEAIADAGFVYWGLFVAFAAIVVAYLIWMWRSEAPERDRLRPEAERRREHRLPPDERDTPGPSAP